MDTSNIYIKMCEGAEEIQKKWTPNIGDYIMRRYTEHPPDLSASG